VRTVRVFSMSDATVKNRNISITQNIAVRLLEKAARRNSQNLIRAELILEIADLIRAESVLNCLPLKFENDGCIQDAVRRLRAIVARGKTLEFEREFSS
jgi:hypothetical protein